MRNAILDNDEPLLGLAAVGKQLDLHPSTASRWILSGARARNGERVCLEGVRRGSKWFTSAPALKRFFAALSAAVGEKIDAEPDRSRAIEAACELEAAGA